VRKTAIIVATALIIIIAGALVAPSFIDWNAYRPQFAAAVKDATGRELRIEGDLRLAVLPSPALSVEGVRLANAPGATSSDMVRLKALRVHVAAAPLLSGRIEIRSIVLVEPVIELETLADGRGNWQLMTGTPEPAGAATGPDAPPAAPPDVRLDDVVIQNGTLVLRNVRAGRTERVERLDGKLVAESLAGPFRADGRATVRSVPVAVTAAVGRLEEGQAAGLSVRLTAEGVETQFSGTVKPQPGGPEIQGKIKSSAGSLSKLAAALGGNSLRELAASQFSLEGRLALTTSSVAVNDLTAQLGDMRVSGAASVDFAPRLRIDAALSVARLDLDQLVAAVPAAQPAAPATDPLQPPALLAASLPADMTVGLDLSVDAIAYRGGVVRQFRMNLGFDHGALALNQLTALLPGGSELSVIGRLSPEKAGQSGLRFDGAVEIGSENLRLVLDWLKLDPIGIPADRLRKAAFKTSIAATPRDIRLTDLDLRIDASRLTGALTVIPGPRPAIGARLALDRINLDAYHPPVAAASSAASSAGSMGRATPGGATAGVAWNKLNAFDANVDIKAGQVTIDRTALANVALEAVLDHGKLNLTKLSVGEIVGAAAHVSGVIDAHAGQPTIDLNAEVSARDPSGLLRLTGITPALSPERLGVLAFKARARGALDNLRIDSDLIALGATVRLNGMLAAAERVDMTLDARHPELTSLLAALAIDHRLAAKNLGPLALRFHAKGTPETAEISGLSIKVGNTDLSGRINLALAGTRPRVGMDLQAVVLDLDPFLPPEPPAVGGRQRAIAAPVPMAGQTGWSRAPLDLAMLRSIDGEAALTAGVLAVRGYRLDKAELRATLKDGVLDLSRVAGGLFGGSFEMKGKLTATAPQPTDIELSTTVRHADIRQAARSAAQVEIVGGQLDAELSVRTRGASQAELIAGLTGSGKFAARDGVVDGFDLPGFSARLNGLDNAVAFVNLAQVALSGGRTPFTRLDGTFAITQGVLRSNDIRLEGPSGAGRGTAMLDLPQQTIDAHGEFHLTEHPRAPPVGLKLTGPLDRPQRSFELQELQVYVLQRVGGAVLRRVLPGQGGSGQGGSGQSGLGQSGTGGSGSAPSTGQPGQSVRPEDILRGILKGLGNQ